jgi:hypothetical protein
MNELDRQRTDPRRQSTEVNGLSAAVNARLSTHKSAFRSR